MRVLIACEESQRVCTEFRKLGHEAYSCDIEPCSGGHPEWHLQQDVTQLLKMKWDLIIAHPPCTYLTVAGNRWFNIEKYGEKAIKRMEDREEGKRFFMMFVNADCKRVAVENPVGIMSSEYRKPDQIIQPYMFGDRARKATCLWLKGLPKLRETELVDPGEMYGVNFSVGASANWAEEDGKILSWNDPMTAKIRSRTFPGIAKAMAEQWGGKA